MSLTDKPLVLIGPMGSGKSSLARRAAAKYGGDIYDTDREFVSRYGDISAFFADSGEAEFRRLEQEIMCEAAVSGAAYIATGGGAVLNRAGMNAIRKTCDIVYLSAPIDVLKSRIERSDRPLKNKLEDVMRERAPLYKKYADYSIDTSVNSLEELEKALKMPRGNRYDIILVDSDDTILDFQSACDYAVRHALCDIGIDADGTKAVDIFKPLTEKFWKKHEAGEITREQLFYERESAFAAALGVSIQKGEFNTAYRKNLRDTRFVRDGAIEFLRALCARGIKAYIITNADLYCASDRLKPVMPYVSGVFISEAIGVSKPQKGFFDAVFGTLSDADRSRVLVFGDSETSDIAGGAAYGLDTCLYAPGGYANTAADFTVKDYAELLKIV